MVSPSTSPSPALGSPIRAALAPRPVREEKGRSWTPPCAGISARKDEEYSLATLRVNFSNTTGSVTGNRGASSNTVYRVGLGTNDQAAPSTDLAPLWQALRGRNTAAEPLSLDEIAALNEQLRAAGSDIRVDNGDILIPLSVKFGIATHRSGFSTNSGNDLEQIAWAGANIQLLNMYQTEAGMTPVSMIQSGNCSDSTSTCYGYGSVRGSFQAYANLHHLLTGNVGIALMVSASVSADRVYHYQSGELNQTAIVASLSSERFQ